MLDFFGQLEAKPSSLAFERLPGVLDQLGVHGEHRTLLDWVVRARQDIVRTSSVGWRSADFAPFQRARPRPEAFEAGWA